MISVFKEIPLYRGYLGLIITDSIDEVKEIIPEFDVAEIYAHTIYHDYKNNQGFSIILNFGNDFRKITHGIITHEVIHATNLIAEGRGIVADFNNDESIAYLAEWITDEIYKELTKQKISV